MAQQIPTKTFQAILEDAVAAVQGAARQLLDFTVGSILRAVMEATAAMALWLQAIALQILSLTRFSTSSGTDADTWGADFAFTRLPAQAASGPVTFSRATPTLLALIPVGTSVQTLDGSQKYTVIADTGQAAFDAAQNAYVLNAGVASISATIEAVVSSSSGNAGAGFINTMGVALAGVDAVTNPSPFENGADSETDAAFRERFVLYIAGLSKATLAAIGSAIKNIQQGVVYSITENQNFDGTPNPGFFYVVVDDGSGAPSGDFLATVGNAVDTVRPIGSSFAVFPPTLVSVDVALTLTVAAGYDKPTLSLAVQTALLTYISALTIGQTLPYTRIAQIAYDVSAGITNVTAVSLQSAASDIVATSQQAIRADNISIT